MTHHPRYEYMKAWWAAHKGRYNDWFVKHPRRAYKNQWNREHPESVKRSNRKQYYKNRGKRRVYNHSYWLENRNRIRQRNHEYHLKHYPKVRERLLIQTSEYAKAHPEVRRRAAVNYKTRHFDRYAAQSKANRVRRNARMRGAKIEDGGAVNALIRSWRRQPFFCCAYCQRTFPIQDLHVDHIIPISRGGKHAKDNICRSCPRCNSRKRDKLPAELDPKCWVLAELK